MPQFTHIDETGACRMVDVGSKTATHRVARASGRVAMNSATLDRVIAGSQAKGDVLEAARIAGVMAAKQTSHLIPLCHPLPIDAVRIDFERLSAEHLGIEATVEIHAKTGVEMEALTAVSVAALTVYDMCKSADRGMTIGEIRLEEKSGGSSGTYSRQPSETS